MKSKKRGLALLLSGSMLLSFVAPLGQAWAQPSPQAAFGQVQDERRMEIGPGAVYTWNEMKLPQGQEKVHAVEFDPKNPALDLQPGMTYGKVYGMAGVTKMADDADAPGNRVIAAINGDFYDMANGVPLGLFMGDSEMLVSPPYKTDWLAFGLKRDGSTIYGLSPELRRELSIAGKIVPISHINRMRFNDEALMLYTSSFHTSTMTNDLGDEVVLDVLEGEVKSGRTLKLKVAEIHKDKGNTPLKAGQVVLSASGKHRASLAGLKAGDEITASFELEDAWKDVKMAIGGVFMLVKDGVAQEHEDKAFYPRVGIGTKADGSVIMVEIDGRAPGFSEGVSYDDLGKIMRDMGAVNALCLDGGGSATFVAKLPGEAKRKILNRPSDGSERKTANGILLVNKAPEGAAAKLVVKPSLERVLAGSSVTFGAAAVDANGHPAALSGTPAWSLGADVGAMDAAGKFVAGGTAGMAEVRVTSDGLTGQGQVEVVDALTALQFPDAVKTFTSGQTFTMNVSALRDGQVIRASNDKFQWRVEGPIGAMDANGVFTATQQTEQSGKIFTSYKGVETSMDVKVGLPPVILEDFENGTGSYLKESGARYKSVSLSEETNEDFVRFGSKSAKLAYDFRETIGTSGAYLAAKDTDSNIAIPGYPEKISLWVYGDGKKHWLRGQIRDGNNAAVGIDYVDQTVGVDFTGWRYLEAVVPKGRPLPLRMDQPVRYMETSNANKTDGVLYIDQIRALYGPANDDMEPPVIKNLQPAEGGTVTTNTPKIQVVGEDFGYDPVKHPATTLIDPDKIRFYVDGVQVESTLYPPKGQIHYTPNVPLADGLHTARVKIRDMSGNVTEKEWSFTVDTGSSKIVYDGPKKVYAGNTYTLDIHAVKAADIKNGEMTFRYDPAKLDGVQVIKGSKLGDGQLQSSVDPAAGTVHLAFAGVSSANLADRDLLGQVQYRIKPEASGPLSIAFISGAISFVSKGDTPFGFFGLPVEAQIANHLRLSWDEHGIVEGMPTTFKVADEQSRPVAGATVAVKGGAGLGVTDAQGVLVTGALTAEVKNYELQAAKAEQFSPIVKFKVSKRVGSPSPSNISVTMGADTTTSRAFTWHTDPATEPTVVEAVKKSEFADFNGANVKRFTGASYLFNTTDTGTVRVHKAEAIGLEPGTEYVFRVGDGQGNFSANGTLKTAAVTGERTKFLFLADSQASNEAGFKLWGDILKKAMGDHPDTEFVVQGGDLVEDGFKENEWNMWFNAAQGVLMQTTVVPVVGNHEVTGTRKTEDYLAHFNHPKNGIDSLKGSNFSFDYKNAHFVVLNSEYDFEEQKQWLRQDLAATNKKWKIVAFHRGPYGSMYDSAHIREAWTPIFDEFQVDIVMNGHDHVYVRTYPMKGKERAADGEGTVYLVGGSSGPKFYQVWARDWQQVTDGEQVQMYVAAEIDGDEMKFVVKTINDRIVDQFRLVKIKPESVVIDKPDVNLAVGESVKLNAFVLPDNASSRSVTWSVYDSTGDAVRVSQDGVVTAQHLGTAIVRATSVWSNVYADSRITVDRMPEVKVDAVTLDQTAGTLKPGAKLQLKAAVTPDHATNTGVVWSVYSDMPKGTAVVSAGGLVEARLPGKAVIRALSAADASKYADFALTVKPEDIPADPEVTEVRLNKTDAVLDVEQTLQLTATVLPDNAPDKSVAWSVYGDANVAVVSKDGLITGANPGVVKIRAASTVKPSVYGEMTLIVKSPEKPPILVNSVKLDRQDADLYVTQTLQLTAAVLPENAPDRSVMWSVYGDASVARVSSTGLVTALKTGDVRIRAASKALPAVYSDLMLRVREEEKSGSGSSSSNNPAKPEEANDGSAASIGKGALSVPAKSQGQTAAAEVRAEELERARKDAPTDSAGVRTIRLELSGAADAGSVEITLPKQAVSQPSASERLDIVTPFAVVTLPTNFLEVSGAALSDTVTLAIGRADAGSLPVDQRAAVGGRPVITLDVKEKGAYRAWSHPEAPVRVRIPYKPSAKEAAASHQLIIRYIGENGSKSAVVPSGAYDAQAGAVTFQVTHFSRYAVAYAEPNFADLAAHGWAKTAIEALAARDIIQGVGENKYAPASPVTRADFVTLLARTLELKASGDPGFRDVTRGDYYYEAIAAAKAFGLIEGTGDGLFRPAQTISRQDLAVIAARALKAVKRIDVARSPDALADFADRALIADYAIGSMAGMAQAGWLQGDGRLLNPQGMATRAEVAVFMNRLMGKLLH